MYYVHTLLNIIHSRQFKSCCHCTISISPMTALCRLVWQKQPDLLIRKIKQLWETKRTNRCFSGTQADPLQGAREPQWCKIERMKRVHVCASTQALTIRLHFHFVFTALLESVGGDSEVQNNSPSILALHWHTSSWYNHIMFCFLFVFLGLRKPCFFPSL